MAEKKQTAVDGRDSDAAPAPKTRLSPLAAEFVPSRNNNNDITNGTNNIGSPSELGSDPLPNFDPLYEEFTFCNLVNVLPPADDQTTVLYAPEDDPYASFPRWAYEPGLHIGPTLADKERVNFLRTVIEALKFNSVRFESVAVDMPTGCIGINNNYYVLSNALEDIFKESITNAGFRFVGSKLLQVLYMLNPSQHSMFTELLKTKLTHQHDMLELYMVTRQHSKARNTAHFLTEVFIQLRGVYHTQQFIAGILMQCLWPLVSKANVPNVQCVCLALKTVGHDLAQLCNASLKQMVHVLEEKSSLNPGKHLLVPSVSTLMRFAWNQRSRDAEVDIRDYSECSVEPEMNPGSVGGSGDRKKSPADGPQIENAAAYPAAVDAEATNGAVAHEAVPEAIDPEAFEEAVIPEFFQEAVGLENFQEAVVPEFFQEAVGLENFQEPVAPEVFQEAVALENFQEPVAPEFFQEAVALENFQEPVAPEVFQEAVPHRYIIYAIAQEALARNLDFATDAATQEAIAEADVALEDAQGTEQ